MHADLFLPRRSVFSPPSTLSTLFASSNFSNNCLNEHLEDWKIVQNDTLCSSTGHFLFVFGRTVTDHHQNWKVAFFPHSCTDVKHLSFNTFLFSFNQFGAGITLCAPIHTERINQGQRSGEVKMVLNYFLITTIKLQFQWFSLVVNQTGRTACFNRLRAFWDSKLDF